MKCVICGKEIEKSKYANAVLCSTECFKRLFWKEALDDTALIIDDECYHVEPENESGTRGFGGREFTIQKNDGEIIKTTNLWHQGEIPDYAYQPDNAKFIGKHS